MPSYRLWLPLVALLSISFVSAYVQRGFLLVAPKVLSAGSTEQLCITLFQLRGRVRVSIYLLPKENSTVSSSLASLTRNFNVGRVALETTECFDFDVPRELTDRTLFIRAVVSSVGFPRFSSQKTSPVSLLPFELITLVQTDKAKYKAGQLVQFRVVTLRSDLTALDETIEQIYITTPANTRLAQFDNVETTTGIVQQTFKLTEEPPLGKWTIHVRRSLGRITRQTFEVEEFVLPRFEVTVDTPNFIIRRANTLTIKVCAEYTFGQPVTGGEVEVRVSSSLSFFRVDRAASSGQSGVRRTARQNITLTDETGDDGCVTLDVLLSKIGLGSRSTLFAFRLSVDVNVTEAGTGLTQSGSSTVPIQTRRFSITTDRFDSTFIKPGLEYSGHATIKDQNGKPVEGERIEVCYTLVASSKRPRLDVVGGTGGVQLSSAQFRSLPIIIPVPVPEPTRQSRTCREFDSDEHGRIKYTIPAQDAGIRRVNIALRRLAQPAGTGQSSRAFISSGSGFKNLRAWFSPTNSYISTILISDPSNLRCDGPALDVSFKSKTVNGVVVFLLMARGRIVEKGTVTLVTNSAQLSIRLRFELTPQFKLLVYHVNDLGEVVSDSRTFEVANCFQTSVRASWNKEQVEPGEEVDYTVRGAANSLCGITAVDKSVRLLSNANELTAERVFRNLNRYIIQQFASPRLIESPSIYCKRPPVSAINAPGGFASRIDRVARQSLDLVRSFQPVGIRGGQPSFLGGEIGRLIETGSTDVDFFFVVEEDDSIKAFDVAGYLPVTNLALETRRCERRNRTRFIPRRGRGNRTVFLGGAANGRDFRRVASAAGGEGNVNILAASASVPEAAPAVVQKALPATVGSPAPLETVIRTIFPETFLFELVSLRSGGEGTVRRRAPDTITSWIGSTFCSHPQLGFSLSNTSAITVFKPFFAQLQLPFSIKRGEDLRLTVSVFNFLASDLSVSVEVQPSDDYEVDGPSKTLVCVRASRPATPVFSVRFSSLGDIDITVVVRTAGSACGTSNAIQASDGLRRTLLVKPEGFPQEETFSAYLCRERTSPPHIRESFRIEQRSSLVPDSERVWVTAVGDLLASSISNLERLVRVPTGCGEQNMLGFVPNIVVRRYLDAVRLITDSLRTRTTNNMRTGYQRELRYRGKDGSYAAFQPQQGSLWLTAYVVRSYAAASSFITIDSADLDISRTWLVGQQAADGSFPRVGRLFHREMKGGVEFGGPEALTAYVILALVESGGQQGPIDKATTFIDKKQTFGTLYAEVLVAHALVVAGHSSGASRVTTLLGKGTRRGGELFWEGNRSGTYGASRATDVEMTAYMVLSLLKLGGSSNLAQAALAVKWINRQRNANGGFRSTQDTVVALTALAEFAIRTFSSSQAANVEVQLGRFQRTWSVDANNRLLTRQAKVEPLSLPNTVVFTVRGLGCALVQAIYRYSTRSAFPNPSFRLSATITKSSCSSLTLRICTSFVRRNAESNMAIVEIEMLSGWVSVDTSLRALRQSGVIERWEFTEGKAVLYFDEFTTTEVCFSVRLLQDIIVKDLKPAVVGVYDYYATEDRFEVEYGPPECTE